MRICMRPRSACPSSTASRRSSARSSEISAQRTSGSHRQRRLQLQHTTCSMKTMQHAAYNMVGCCSSAPQLRGPTANPHACGCVWVCLHVRACVRACHMVHAPTFILVPACARVPHPGVCAQGRWELKQRWQMPWADNDFQEAGAQTQHAVADSPIDPSSQHATDTMGHATAKEQYATGRIDLRRFGRHCCRTSACMLRHLTRTRSFCGA